MSVNQPNGDIYDFSKFERILITAGEGGHEAQARLLLQKLLLDFPRIQLFLCVEGEFSGDDNIINVSQKTKFGPRWLGLMIAAPFMLFNFFSLLRIIIKRQPSLIISLGPYISVLSYICCVILKKRFVHIETRARFSEPSLTCKVLMKFNVLIFVQNESLLKNVRNSYYCGRL